MSSDPHGKPSAGDHLRDFPGYPHKKKKRGLDLSDIGGRVGAKARAIRKKLK